LNQIDSIATREFAFILLSVRDCDSSEKIGCTPPLAAPEVRDRMIDYRIILLRYHDRKGFVCWR